jgi:hypothetical protein
MHDLCVPTVRSTLRVVACPFGVAKFGKGLGEPADGILMRGTHAQGGIPRLFVPPDYLLEKVYIVEIDNS